MKYMGRLLFCFSLLFFSYSCSTEDVSKLNSIHNDIGLLNYKINILLPACIFSSLSCGIIVINSIIYLRKKISKNNEKKYGKSRRKRSIDSGSPTETNDTFADDRTQHEYASKEIRG